MPDTTKPDTTRLDTEKPVTNHPAANHTIIDDLSDADLQTDTIAQRHRMTKTDLARRCDDPDHADAIALHVRLAERRTALILAEAQAAAAHRLLELAKGKEPSETARKACVDLLKLGAAAVPVLLQPGTENAPAPPHDPNAPPSHEHMVELLKAITANPDPADAPNTPPINPPDHLDAPS